METGLGLVPPTPLKWSGNLLENWNNFKQEFRIYLLCLEANRQPTEKVKIALFLNLIGKEANELHKNRVILYPEDDSGRGITHKTLINGFDNYIKTCHKSVTYNSFIFEDRKQEKGEPFDDFLLAIFRIAKKCNFSDFERKIRDKIVAGINNSNLRMTLISLEDQSIDNIIEYCRDAERNKNVNKLSRLQLNDIELFLYKKMFQGKQALNHDSSDITVKMNYPPPMPGSSRQDKEGDDMTCSNEDMNKEKSDSQDKTESVEFQNEMKKNRPLRINRANRAINLEGEQPVLDENDPESKIHNQKHKDEQRNMNKNKNVLGKNYVCADCNKGFARLHNLENHKKLHTGEGLFTCQTCNKSYTREAHLRNHMLNHSDKSFICEICEKKFARKHHLDMHLTAHYKKF